MNAYVRLAYLYNITSFYVEWALLGVSIFQFFTYFNSFSAETYN